jgi:hypothetical protein
MKKERMRKLNEWAKGNPQGLVIMAQQFTVAAEPCFEFLKMIKSGDRMEAFSSLPKAKEWVRLYWNHRQMQREKRMGTFVQKLLNIIHRINY